MYSMKLLKFLLAGAAFTLPVFLSVDASPIASSQVFALGKRTTIKLYHIASAESAKSIKDHGVKLQTKTPGEIGDDFNPVGTGGFYASDNRADIIEWCKGRQGANAKKNCADVVSFDFDHDASLKVHTFSSPASLSTADIDKWMDTPDFKNWHEFMQLCVHGQLNDEDHKLPADLADGGKTLDLIIGPMESSNHIKQYAFRTPKALEHLKSPTVTPSGV